MVYSMKVEVNKNRDQITLVPEAEEDLWTLRLVLRRGDYVYTRVTRDVSIKNSKEKERKPIEVKLKVDNVDFQPLSGRLRIFGVIVEGPERFGIKGKHQSAYIFVGSKIIAERYPSWDERTINKLKSSGPKGKAIAIAIDYDEYAISLITPLGVYNIEYRPLGLSGKGSDSREKEIEDLVNDLAKALLEYIKREKTSVLILAGPGTLKNLIEEKIKKMSDKIRVVIDNVSNGGIAGINEVLRRQSVLKALKEFHSLQAQEVLDEFMHYISKDPKFVVYTLEDVYNAAKIGAIDKLVILDKLLYSINEEERTKAEEILISSEKSGAKVFIVTEDFPSSSTLIGLGGIIGILRYSLERF